MTNCISNSGWTSRCLEHIDSGKQCFKNAGSYFNSILGSLKGAPNAEATAAPILSVGSFGGQFFTNFMSMKGLHAIQSYLPKEAARVYSFWKYPLLLSGKFSGILAAVGTVDFVVNKSLDLLSRYIWGDTLSNLRF